MFQDFNLFDTLTGYEHISLPLSIQEVHYKEMDEQVNEIHRQLGMSHVLTKYLYQMSDGEK